MTVLGLDVIEGTPIVIYWAQLQFRPVIEKFSYSKTQLYFFPIWVSNPSSSKFALAAGIRAYYNQDVRIMLRVEILRVKTQL